MRPTHIGALAPGIVVRWYGGSGLFVGVQYIGMRVPMLTTEHARAEPDGVRESGIGSQQRAESSVCLLPFFVEKQSEGETKPSFAVVGVCFDGASGGVQFRFGDGKGRIGNRFGHGKARER
jgi:hypothetical protein